MFAKNPRFIGLKFPTVSKPESLEKKYVGKLPKLALSLMKGLLAMDPNERLNGTEALCHPFFDGLRTAEEEAKVQKSHTQLPTSHDSNKSRLSGKTQKALNNT